MSTPKIPTITIYVGNDQYVDIPGLQDARTGTYMNAATVTGTLRDRTGTIVIGFDHLTGVYVTASNGEYQIQIEETFTAPLGGGYILSIDAAQAGKVLHIEIPVVIKTRRG